MGTYFYRGPNPTVDLVIFDPEIRKVLLIQRGKEPCRGMWALPGGFQNTSAKRGEIWEPGFETPQEAALREAKEETGLEFSIEPIIVGVYEGGGRDPRDTPEAWSRSTAFCVQLPDGFRLKPEAGDDAASAEWFELDALPELAFDHDKIIYDAIVAIIDDSLA
jgi:8-oxo-dGTP diphosphatase